MTADQIIKQLEPLGKASYKKVLLNHGIREPVLGVKIEDLKKIQKRVKKDHRLALDLYATGIYDAMYLAGLIADESKMSKADLRRWLAGATSDALCAYTVPRIAAEGNDGWELAMEWIGSDEERIASAGWETLSCLVSLTDDAELDLAELKRLIRRVGNTIHAQPNQVRYAMNGFVIAAGSFVAALTALALETAEKIGRVTVDMGNTACKVPYAPDYIRKVQKRGSIGKKRKSARC